MSWSIVLFNSLEHIFSVADLDENKLVAFDFDSAILNHFVKAKVDDRYVIIDEEDFSIEFSLDDGPESNKMLFIYGEKALFEMVILARKENWQIYDSGLDAMLDLENPSSNGYTNFINYLQHIKNKIDPS